MQTPRHRGWGRPAAVRLVGLVLAVASGGPAGLAAAQPVTARVVGRVLDTTGQPLPAVLVEAEQGPRTWRAETGANGRYALVNLPAGTYTVRFSLAGFVTVLRREVAVPADGAIVQDATLSVAAAASVVVTGRDTFRGLSNITRDDELVAVADAASTGVIGAEELAGRAERRPADALEAVPGLLVSQHSGEGKANQYYLRGFNLDHGTDLALSVAGMPVNLPTHGHGQGYADMNFLIPELVSGIQYRKGTYAAQSGDFSAAGTVAVRYLNVLAAPLVRVEGGSFGYGRVLGAASPPLGGGHLLVAAEAMGNDGPWDRPGAMRRWNGLLRYSRGTAATGLVVTGLAYRARWNASDQIPARAVSPGGLSRFGYLDRTNGGETGRLGGVVEWQQATRRGITRVDVYGFNYNLDLFSNFTYFLDNPTDGDQFEQRDARVVLGGRASHTWSPRGLGRETLVSVGIDVRHDAIGELGLYRTAGRRRLSTVREDTVGQTSGAVYAELQTRWSDHVRTVLGARADAYRWRVDAGDDTNRGRATASIANPKASVAFGPWRRTEIYASAGGGFHSNDGRGATLRRDPANGAAVAPVDSLVRARGAEVGVRSLALPRVHTTLAVWRLGLDSELLFVGDAGTTESSRPSHRVGVEWDLDVRATRWLTFDASVAYSRARFTDDAPEGDRVPGAIEGVASAGVNAAAGRWRGALRWRHFGPRPLTEDDRVRSRASNLFSAEAGWQVASAWRLEASVLNLFDSLSSDIDYFYTSRLPGEPAAGVAGVHFHPVEPRALRVALVFGC